MRRSPPLPKSSLRTCRTGKSTACRRCMLPQARLRNRRLRLHPHPLLPFRRTQHRLRLLSKPPRRLLPAESSDENAEPPAEPQIDKRPILYAKGKLISVECTTGAGAVVTFSSGTRTLKLKTSDYRVLTLIGADQF